jgi:hypothetical protein
MSAKACLLCGKTLSRIWSGAGEDFCSREHRNQYRLRRGLDRLQEANKVASVMRRRESPRQIATSSLINAGTQSPRAFLRAKAPAARPERILSAPRPAAAFRPRLTVTKGAFPTALAAGSTSEPRPGTASAIGFPPRRVAYGRAVAQKTQVRIQRASWAVLLGKASDCPSSAQMLASRWRPAAQLVVGNMLRRVQTPELNPIDPASSARRLSAPSQGRALRVSLAIGFHVPKCNPPRIMFAQPETAGLTWPVMINLSEEPFDGPMRQAIGATIPISIPFMRIPAAPPSNFDGRFRWPGTFAIPLHSISPVVRHRTACVPFGSADEGSGKEYFQ